MYGRPHHIHYTAVYYERSGQVDQARLRAAGCGTDELVWSVSGQIGFIMNKSLTPQCVLPSTTTDRRHYIYATEFCYNKLHPRETAKTITVFDVEGAWPLLGLAWLGFAWLGFGSMCGRASHDSIRFRTISINPFQMIKAWASGTWRATPSSSSGNPPP